MSVSREEERNKTCSSRGLGIAAAAIGVGVGAALYYYFSKRPENPAVEGSTTSGWACEQPHVLHNDHDSSSSFDTTISEHSTSDTSIDSSSSDSICSGSRNILRIISRRLWVGDVSTDLDLDEHSDEDSDEDMGSNTSDQSGHSESSESDRFVSSQIISDDDSDENIESDLRESDVQYAGSHPPADTQENAVNIGSDSETNMEWNVTPSSLDIPRAEQRSRSPIMMQFGDLTARFLKPYSVLWKHNDHDSSSSFDTTISEHSTSDTSIDSSSSDSICSGSRNILRIISRRLWVGDVSTDLDLDEHSDEDSDEDMGSNTSDQSGHSESSESDRFVSSQIISDDDSDENIESDLRESDVQYAGSHPPADTQENAVNIGSDSETNMEWNVTPSSLDIPRAEQRSRSPIMMQFGDLTARFLKPYSVLWNRERSWSLEECSICFEVMLKTQEVLALACTHRFHQSCIMPWLEQQQTCPNCRKAF